MEISTDDKRGVQTTFIRLTGLSNLWLKCEHKVQQVIKDAFVTFHGQKMRLNSLKCGQVNNIEASVRGQ